MLYARKYRIYPNEEQQTQINKTLGCCRFVWNWALGIKKEAYEKDKTNISINELSRRLTHELKKENPWLNEVEAKALFNTLQNLDKAFQNFFKRKTTGYPVFKTKHGRQSFQTDRTIYVNFQEQKITIPKIKNIKAKLHRKFEGEIRSITISREPSGRYFASVLVRDENSLPTCLPVEPDTALGIDMDVPYMVVCSDGRKFGNPRNLKKYARRLKILQRKLAKKTKGSKNRDKARVKVARLHEKIKNKRDYNIQQITHQLTHDSQVRTICAETLDVKEMLQNRYVARVEPDAAFGKFLSVLEKKCEKNGINFLRVPKESPTSQMCHVCGFIKENLQLSQETWKCPECGTKHDRDINAAINIKKIAIEKIKLAT